MTGANETVERMHGLDQQAWRFASRLIRLEPDRRLPAYPHGLVAPVACRNGRQPMEVAGDRSPGGAGFSQPDALKCRNGR